MLFFSSLTTQFGVEYEIRSTLLIGGATLPFVIFIIYSMNTQKTSGLFFSSEGVIVVKNGKRHIAPWTEVKIQRSFNFFNIYSNVNFTFSSLDKVYKFPLFFPTKDSFKSLAKKYAPKEHQIRNVI